MRTSWLLSKNLMRFDIINKIFAMMHDDHYHAEFHWVYSCIIADLYIWNLSWCLKQYITHCFKCLHYQTARHALYEALHSIIELSIFFHEIRQNRKWEQLLWDEIESSWDRTSHSGFLINLATDMTRKLSNTWLNKLNINQNSTNDMTKICLIAQWNSC